MFIIPTDVNEENYSLQVDLDGVNYELSLRWNERSEAWFMAMALTDGTKLVSGIKLTTRTPLFTWFTSLDAPLGRLVIFDSSGTDEDPGLYDLGIDRRCQLVYATEAEFALIIQGGTVFDDYLDALT